MSVLPEFELSRPDSIDEALAEVASGAVPYAGGTELLLAMRAGLLRPQRLVDLKRVHELAGIEAGDDSVEIGGSTTHQSASKDEAIRSRLPALSAVLHGVGNPRVRASGTLGGNLCFAEPKSDVATILIALDAEVTLRSSKGSRMIPVREFWVGPYTTVREDDELLTSISIPDPDGSRIAYEKFQTMERPTVGVAAVGRADGSVLLIVGAVGPTPVVFESASDDVAAEEVAASVEIIPDLTGSERYKRNVTAVTARKALERLRERT